MQDESKKDLGLERVKKWLYAKGLDERSSGCVLCGSCYGHGPANPMEDVPGPKTKCPLYEFYRFQRHTPKSRWLMAQRVFHGLDPITPELKGIIYSCTTCLMCQELCGVRSDGFGPWDITVAMREQITERVRSVIIATCTKDCSNTIIPGLKRAPNLVFGQTDWGSIRSVTKGANAVVRRLLCRSSKRSLRHCGSGQADAKGRRGLCYPR